MADFCRTCVRDMFDCPGEPSLEKRNDLVGWLSRSRMRWSWTLCEGCCVHLFDNGGRKLCDQPTPGDEEEIPFMAGCTMCYDLFTGRNKVSVFTAFWRRVSHWRGRYMNWRWNRKLRKAYPPVEVEPY